MTQWADSAYGENKKLSVVEVGCGTGRSLLRLPGVGALDGKVEYIIGFDYSPEMLRVARRVWRTLTNNPALRAPAWDMLQRFRFYQLDALEMNEYFIDGRVRNANKLDELQYIEELGVTELDHTAFDASAKVFVCLLNTIGVILDHARKEAIRSMMKALGKGDRLVLSVFDANVFEREARVLYPKIIELTGEFDEASSFDDGEATFQGKEYFSRWFHRTTLEDDLKAIAQDAGIGMQLSTNDLKAGGHFLVLTRNR